MSKKRTVRIGVIGIGGMGANHAKRILEGEISGAELTAVCDLDESRFADFPSVAGFTTYEKLLESGLVDAVVIGVPHYSHTSISIAAIEHSIHVLVEKPLAVHKADCDRIITAYHARERDDLVFGVMFNQRTRPVFRKLKAMISGGDLGVVRRINWTITDWFRSELYYRAGGWRATWKGEGGGVLVNQCPHQLDLMQWFFGMPERVRAFGALGKYHDIEVEDEVTAYMEYSNGATAVFIASTGEAPGTNRLEIAADRGRVIVEGDEIEWIRNEVPTGEYSKTTEKRFVRPPVWNITVPVDSQQTQEHAQVLSDFVAAIRGDGALVAHGSEGIHSVELGNAILASVLTSQTVELPLDAADYERLLERLVAESRFQKVTVETKVASADEMNSSY